jgi:hypothetical protein
MKSVRVMQTTSVMSKLLERRAGDINNPRKSNRSLEFRGGINNRARKRATSVNARPRWEVALLKPKTYDWESMGPLTGICQGRMKIRKHEMGRRMTRNAVNIFL